MAANFLPYILLAAAVAVVLAFLMYGFRTRLSVRNKWLFGALRFLTLFTLLLLIFNPKIERVTYEDIKPTLSVVVDNSTSIRHLGQTEAVAAWVASLQSNPALNERFDLHYYSFGESLRKLDSLDFSDPQTNLSQALHSLDRMNGREATPVVLVTDGNATYGSDYEHRAHSLKAQVFPVVVGDTTTHRDLQLTRINTNRYAYLKNEFPVEVFANYSGHTAASSLFEVRQGSVVLHRQTVDFTPQENARTLQFTLPADRVGVQRYTAVLQPLENEQNTDNNSRPFAVEVIDQATNVLLVSSIEHPDLGAWRQVVTANEQRKLITATPDEAMQHLDDAQLLLLYQPDSRFESLLQAADRNNINRLYVTGLHTDWRFLNRVQEDFSKRITYPREAVHGRINPNYTAFAVDDPGFASFPPVQGSLGNFQAAQNMDVLLHQQVNGIDTETPLLFSMETGNGKIAVFDAQGLWKWRANAYLKHGDFATFDNFVGNFVQYLSSNKKRTRLDVEWESFYNSTEPIRIQARFLDKNFVFDNRASLLMDIAHTETGQTQTLPLLLRTNYYEINLSGFEAGDYHFTVRAANENTARSGTFQIVAYDMEQQFIRPDVDKLERLAQNTEGQHYFLDAADGLAQNLLGDTRYTTTQTAHRSTDPLIDWKILLFALVLLLAIEWFARKYQGLV